MYSITFPIPLFVKILHNSYDTLVIISAAKYNITHISTIAGKKEKLTQHLDQYKMNEIHLHLCRYLPLQKPV